MEKQKKDTYMLVQLGQEHKIKSTYLILQSP